MLDRIIWLTLVLTFRFLAWYLIGITVILILSLSVRYWRGADRRVRRGTPGITAPGTRNGT
jgi:hypothetical protein